MAEPRIKRIKRKVDVKTHLRKIDGEPSEEIKQYALSRGIYLKPGETLVRRHKRNIDSVERENVKRLKVNKKMNGVKPVVQKIEYGINKTKQTSDFKGYGDINLSWDTKVKN